MLIFSCKISGAGAVWKLQGEVEYKIYSDNSHFLKVLRELQELEFCDFQVHFEPDTNLSLPYQIGCLRHAKVIKNLNF